jgi:hypothetical protein
MVALLCGLLIISATKPAYAEAKTFTVDSTGDENDLDFPGGTFDGSSDGECDVSSLSEVRCTLRAAIQQANATKGADTIAFAVPGDGPHTISPGSSLPVITKPVTIDGYTQGDATPATTSDDATENTIPLAKDGTNAVLKIVLRGPGAASGRTGLKLDGVSSEAAASNSVIRGLVVQFFFHGVFLSGGKGYKVEGNFLGTSPSGTSAPEGNLHAVTMLTSGSTIGGTTPDKRNLISGNLSHGIAIEEGGKGGNKVEGNLIGTAKDGTSPLGNGASLNDGDGVHVFTRSNNNTIGDSDPRDGATNAANTIAFNDDNGVGISGSPDPATGNRILSNSIFDNGKLGINLLGGTQDASGVTANDGDDPNTPKTDPDKDIGPNNLQNYPEIAGATTTPVPGFTTIGGKLTSTPSTRKKRRTFTIQFFSNPSTGSTDEGKTFLGEIKVTTDKEGEAPFTFVPPTEVVPVGHFITATATNNKTGDTSEFSEAERVEPPDLGGG